MAIAIMLGLLAVQSIRLEGFKIWPIDVEGWKPKAERLQATIDNITAAQDLAEQNARTARLEDEAEYRGITERIDNNAKRDLALAGDATELFIAAGGVRPEGADRSPGRAGACTQDRDPADTQGAGRAPELDATPHRSPSGLPDGYVIVRADDVRLCTINTIKAEAGHELAVELERASSAD
ncbi:MAG: hypothetical protein KDE07_01185 [Sphingomonadaceae bacterium]|nr:hypothetical protein [Sphingomonadaceae bacterium]MCP5383515.1 hypothetical protein [Altererythrobacter sp.]